MTKLKSKKMTKSTLALIIMAVAMVAMLAFGGTYAYFTATATDITTSATTGTIHLTRGDVVTKTNAKVVKGETVLGAVTYNVADTDVNTYVFVTLTAEVSTGATFQSLFGADLAVSSGWEKLTAEDNDYTDGIVYYQLYTAGATAATTDNGALPFLANALTVTASPEWVEGQQKPAEMGASVTVTITGEAIQAYSFDTPAAAYAAL